MLNGCAPVDYMINCLQVRGPSLDEFILTQMIALCCRITKLGWLDDERFKMAYAKIRAFFQVWQHSRRPLRGFSHAFAGFFPALLHWDEDDGYASSAE